MKNVNRSIAALILMLVLLFNVVSCNIPSSPSTPNTDGGSQAEEKTFYIEGPSNLELEVGESITLMLICKEDIEGEPTWTSSSSCASVTDGKVIARSTGVAIIKASLGDKVTRVIVTVVAKSGSGSGGSGSGNNGTGGNNSGNVTIPDGTDPITSDPYVGVDVDEFYENYTPAISYMDAYYRTKHNLMSGSIEEQHQEPTIASYQPKSNGKYIKNTSYLFSEDGNTYYVIDGYGEITLEIFKGGAYVVLEEVAAYVFAFGEPPVNQTSSKKTKPYESAWGEYLRLNNTIFSGSTSKYPYEPALPRISGCGGDLTYYEMDIGTTGTDCDPSYDIVDYNNGYTITRGAARLVYSCKDKNGNNIIDLDERYVFYTYNHYNDFQEYLNYYGGWGEMFGNITGGGTLSSKYDYNPTPYVDVERRGLYAATPLVIIYYYVPKNEYAA